jgi:predicted lactoylglutathione lyase
MTKTLFISLSVSELAASTAFYRARGLSQNPKFSSQDGLAIV